MLTRIHFKHTALFFNPRLSTLQILSVQLCQFLLPDPCYSAARFFECERQIKKFLLSKQNCPEQPRGGGGAGLGRQGFPWPYCHPDDTACFARDFTVRAHNNNIIQKKKKNTKYKIKKGLVFCCKPLSHSRIVLSELFNMMPHDVGVTVCTFTIVFIPTTSS